MHLFYTPDILLRPDEKSYTLSEEESKHCIRVLRLANGDNIVLIDGKGGWYEAEIIDDHVKHCTVKIIETKKETGKRNSYLHVAIAPTKNMDRLEWFVEKAVEIGTDEISLISCRNSERGIVKNERLDKVAIAAAKQSLKAYLPVINELTDLKKFIDTTSNFAGQKFIAHCHINEEKERQHLKNLYIKDGGALVLIGPEGDFTLDEVKVAIDNGFKEIGLGESRLRTETAALYACAVVNVMNE